MQRAEDGAGQDRRVEVAAREVDHAEREGRDRADAGGEAVEAVEEVDHVHHGDDPDDRQRDADRLRQHLDADEAGT